MLHVDKYWCNQSYQSRSTLHAETAALLRGSCRLVVGGAAGHGDQSHARDGGGCNGTDHHAVGLGRLGHEDWSLVKVLRSRVRLPAYASVKSLAPVDVGVPVLEGDNGLECVGDLDGAHYLLR